MLCTEKFKMFSIIYPGEGKSVYNLLEAFLILNPTIYVEKQKHYKTL